MTSSSSRPFQRYRMALLVVAVVAFSSSCRPCAARRKKGTATFYTPPYVPSACYGFTDQSGMTAAANEDELWRGGSACGKYYKVRCLRGTNQGVKEPCKKGKTVTVKIIDKCPLPGCQGTIDLSAAAFRHIAEPDEGKIDISYERVWK